MPRDLETRLHATLIDLDTDDCDLQWVFDRVRRLSPGSSYNELRRSTLWVVGELLDRGLAEPHLIGETFWAASPAEPMLDQVRHGWDRYGKDLNMGDVAYFTTTAAGRAEVHSSSQP